MKSLRRITMRRLSIKSESFFDIDFGDLNEPSDRKTGKFTMSLDFQESAMRDVYRSNLERQQGTLIRNLRGVLPRVKLLQGADR